MLLIDPETNLRAIGLSLPEFPKPVASYVPAKKVGETLLYVSGQIPTRQGTLIASGLVGGTVSVEQAQECARVCVLNGLAAIKGVIGNLRMVKSVIRIGVYVACGPAFTDHPKVANGASDVLEKAFAEAGKHARVSMGASSLPLGAPVEVEMLVELFDQSKSPYSN